MTDFEENKEIARELADMVGNELMDMEEGGSIMQWIKSESTERPETVDATSSKTSVYLRRSIKEMTRTDEVSGESIAYYEYEEAKLTHEEYGEYLQVAEAVNMRQIRADVDYIALCSGVDLEV